MKNSTNAKKLPSIKGISLLISALLIACLSVIVFVFVSNMFKIVNEHERNNMRQQGDVASGIITAATANMQSIARDWSSWDAIYDYVLGNSDRLVLEQEMLSEYPLRLHNLNFMVIKDMSGADLHSLFYSAVNEETIPMPEGFSDYLNTLAADLLQGFDAERNYNFSEKLGKDGFFFYGGVCYYVCAMPVLNSDESVLPAGTFFFGRIFDEAELQRISGRGDLNHGVMHRQSPELADLEFIDNEAFSFGSTKYTYYRTVNDYFGDDSIVLKIEEPRRLRADGLTTVLITCAVSVVLALLLTGFIFYILSRLEQNTVKLQKSMLSLHALEAILNALDAYIYVSDPQTDKILFINDRMKEHFGLEGDMVGQVCWQVLQAGQTGRCDFCPLPRLLKNPDEPLALEMRSTLNQRYYNASERIIEWTDGQKVHLQHAVDITDARQAELARKKRLEQQELLSAISQILMRAGDTEDLIKDALHMAGEFMDVGQAFLAAYRKDEGALECVYEWCGESARPFMGGANSWPLSPDMQLYQDFIAKGYAVVSDFSQETHPNFAAVEDYSLSSFLNISIEVGGAFWGILGFSLSGQTRLWPESDVYLGKLIAGVFSGVISRDIAAKELLAAKEAAVQASQAKGEFLSRMSHEMRTPMNAIIGMTGIARNTVDAAKKEYCLEKIDNASKHLLGVINDILDMSKIEANKFELSYIEFDFEKMLIDVAGVVNFRADEKRQNLVISFDEDIPPSLIGDEIRLGQVITNLLTNAIKFTPESGSITLRVRKKGGENGYSDLRFEVADTGIGIEKEQQPRLFSSFEQADGGIARKYGGTGLGLAICKKIVEKMGGNIWVESELGQGATFIFEIRMANGHVKRRREHNAVKGISDVRVLAVDDSPEIRDYFSYIMPSLGLSCDVADSGVAALRMINDNRDNPYNIFFVDWMMPGVNGIELTKMIKRVMQDNAVIIMISVTDWSSIEKDALAAGVDRFVSKPLFPSTIYNAISEIVGLEPAAKVAQGKRRIHSFKGKTLLLVEDVEINREIIVAFLEESKLSIECASGGRQALEMFLANPHKYSLILMDIHMPDMDGYEATAQIRALPQGQAVPIIAMTANVFREDVEKCLEAGMNDHIGKPVNVEELMDKLHKHLPQAEPGERRAGEEKPDAPAAVPAAPLDYAELLPLLDAEDGLHRVMNNKKLYARLLNKFDGRQMTEAIVDAVKGGDFAQTQQAAHALKGVSANLGLAELNRISREIEARAKNGVAADNMLDSLLVVAEDTRQAIERLLTSE